MSINQCPRINAPLKLGVNVSCPEADAVWRERKRVIITELWLTAEGQWRNDRERGNKYEGESDRNDDARNAKPMQTRSAPEVSADGREDNGDDNVETQTKVRSVMRS